MQQQQGLSYCREADASGIEADIRTSSIQGRALHSMQSYPDITRPTCRHIVSAAATIVPHPRAVTAYITNAVSILLKDIRDKPSRARLRDRLQSLSCRLRRGHQSWLPDASQLLCQVADALHRETYASSKRARHRSGPGSPNHGGRRSLSIDSPTWHDAFPSSAGKQAETSLAGVKRKRPHGSPDWHVVIPDSRIIDSHTLPEETDRTIQDLSVQVACTTVDIILRVVREEIDSWQYTPVDTSVRPPRPDVQTSAAVADTPPPGWLTLPPLHIYDRESSPPTARLVDLSTDLPGAALSLLTACGGPRNRVHVVDIGINEWCRNALQALAEGGRYIEAGPLQRVAWISSPRETDGWSFLRSTQDQTTSTEASSLTLIQSILRDYLCASEGSTDRSPARPPARTIFSLEEDIDRYACNRPIPCFNGAAPPWSLESPLPLGRGLVHLIEAVPGLNCSVWHFGRSYSCDAFQRAPLNTGHCSLTLVGWRDWCLVQPADTRRFESLVSAVFGAGECEQWVRHHGLFISPVMLQWAGIRFSTLRTGPGDILFTEPGQYFSAIDVTDAVAVSASFLLPGEELQRSMPPDPPDICPLCPTYAITPAGRRVPPSRGPSELLSLVELVEAARRAYAVYRQANDELQRPRRPVPSRSETPIPQSARAGDICNDLAEPDELVSILRRWQPICQLPAPRIYRPQLAVWDVLCQAAGRQALTQLVDLVEAQRHHTLVAGVQQRELADRGNQVPYFLSGTAAVLPNSQVDFQDEAARAIAAALPLLCAQTASEHFNTYAKRLAQYRIAAIIQAVPKEERVTTKSILSQAIWYCKGKLPLRFASLQHHHTKGRKMLPLLSRIQGIIALLWSPPPSSRAATTPSLDLNAEDVELLYSLLPSADDSYIHTILTAGAGLSRSLSLEAIDVEFMWEDGGPSPKSLHGEHLIKEQLLPRPTTELYRHETFEGTSRPTRWPSAWPWPMNPLLTPPGSMTGAECELCSKYLCHCTAEPRPGMIRICRDSGKAAVSDEHRVTLRDHHDGHTEALTGHNSAGQLSVMLCYPGQLPAGSIIGYMTGEILPPYSTAGDLVFDIIRPLPSGTEHNDGLDRSPICQLDSRRRGTLLRLSPHNCKPNSELSLRFIGGRYIPVLVACRDIMGGEIITLKQGRGYSRCACYI